MGHFGQMEGLMKLPCIIEVRKLESLGQFCPVFINEILLDPSHATICLLIIYSYFPATTVEFCSCDRDAVASKILKIFTIFPCQEKFKESLCGLRKEI